MMYKEYQNIPDDWDMVKMADIATINPRKPKMIKINGQEREIEPTDQVTFLAMDDVSEASQISTPQIKDYQEVSTGYTSFEENDILVAKITPCFENGKGAFAKNLKNKIGFGSTEFHVIRTVNSVNRKWLHYLTNSYFFRKRGELNMQGSAGQKRVPTNFVSTYYLPRPPKVEQGKIVDIIFTWDSAISTLENLIQTKKRHKKGLMQQLLSGKKRFPEFEGEEWIEVKIGYILNEVERDVDWDDSALYDLISVKRRSEGIVHRESLYGHEIKTKNLKTVSKDDFIISRMQVLHGASALASEEFEGTKVSGSYHTLIAHNPDKFSIKYFNYLSRTPYLYHLAYISSHGVHIEKMTFKIDDYLKKKIKVPPTKKEQNKIVEVLDAVDREIALLKKEMTAIKKQKKGLMQQLLTGKVRVNEELTKTESYG